MIALLDLLPTLLPTQFSKPLAFYATMVPCCLIFNLLSTIIPKSSFAKIQGFDFAFADLHEVSLIPFLQPGETPKSDSHTLQCIDYCHKCVIIHELVGGALCLIQVVDRTGIVLASFYHCVLLTSPAHVSPAAFPATW